MTHRGYVFLSLQHKHVLKMSHVFYEKTRVLLCPTLLFEGMGGVSEPMLKFAIS